MMIDPKVKEQIDALSHFELVQWWRHAPPGDPLFVGPAGDYFKERLASLGGITPALSKQVGWD